MKKLTNTLFILSLILISCYDTRSFESVRNIKTGMSILEVEQYMGNTLVYKYINDSTETRIYVYDNPKNGVDLEIEVTYVNEKVKSVK